jgi:UDP-N-acetylmuramoyl-tripeptide--D-alanyl-D-alanine ligase
VVNLDDPYIRVMPLPEGVKRVTWGTDLAADIRVFDYRLDAQNFRTYATLSTPSGDFELELPVLGEHMAHNAAGAIAVAYALNLDLGRAVSALAGYEPVGMRLRVEELPGGVTALNDAYNANPASMKASLKVLSAMEGRRVAVLGDMLELGPLESLFHTEVVAYADTLGLDLLVLVGPRMNAASVGAASTDLRAFEDPTEAVRMLTEWLDAGDVVLFKGSRGARVEQILQDLTHDRAGLSGAR